MAGDEDLDRLLAEVDAATSGKPVASSPAVASSAGGAVAAAERGRVAAAARAGVIAGAIVGVLLLVVVFFLQWLPFIGHPIAAGTGAFAAGFLTTFYHRFRNGG